MRSNCWFCVLLLLAGAVWVQGAEAQPVLYVQLIQGTDNDKPPVKEAKPIGPKLTQLLTPVFRWKKYWEVHQDQVRVSPRQVRKLALKVRDLEIELRADGNLELRLFSNGKLVRTARQKLKPDTLEIMGGNKDDNVWFVVVRSDKPL